ncbi:MAG: phospholipase [Planctomycetes bacterium]|nr:phospholipase [Planctomycetota bacterium]
MSVSAPILEELHRIHRQLSDLRERLSGGPKQVKMREGNVAHLEADLGKAKDDHKAARMTVDQKQLLLKSAETKILDRRTQLNQCNTNREYQTMLEQIAADEMAKSVLEDEILEALDKIERTQVVVVQAEANVAKGQAELSKVKGAVSEAEAALRVDVQRLEAELAAAEQNLPADFRDVYLRLTKARGEDALARVVDDCCGGCYQQLTPNLLNQVQMSRIIVCAGCGRLLYRGEAQ